MAEMTRTAFKEWSLICNALQSGRQSLILRKGGIAEGRKGFRFEHDSFYLFPTQFHEQQDSVSEEIDGPIFPDEGTIRIHLVAQMDFAREVSDWETVEALQPYHVWKEDVIRERFEYNETPGLSLAFVRIFKLPEPWEFPDHRSYGGCRSWVELPVPPESHVQLLPVIDEAEHEARKAKLTELLA